MGGVKLNGCLPFYVIYGRLGSHLFQTDFLF